MSKRSGWVRVTGDIVLDCHMYGGLPATGATAAGSGASYAEVPGGAALTRFLLDSTLQARAAAWDDAYKAWEAENQRLQSLGKPQHLLGELFKQVGLRDAYGATLDPVLSDDLKDIIPTDLRSFGVWTAQPRNDRKDCKEKVWRIAKDSSFGYGPFDQKRTKFRFKHNRECPPEPPVLTIIDDGALKFRHKTSRNLWRACNADAPGYFLLKTTRPLACGDLWGKLEAVKDRLIVVVSVTDLRRMDIQIDTDLSWEQCAEHTQKAMQEHPVGQRLCASAAHVIVTFGSAGAFWVETGGEGGTPVARLIYDPLHLEDEYESHAKGTVYGLQTCFTVAVAHHLMRYHLQLDQAATDPDRGSPFSDPETMRQALKVGISAGLEAKRELLSLGHGPVADPEPRIPAQTLGKLVAGWRTSRPCVEVPATCTLSSSGCQWTILTALESPEKIGGDPKRPLTGLGMLTARHGPEALWGIPALSLGPSLVVDRADIESLRTLKTLIDQYEKTPVQKKPLCIGVFGPPGAGKSFGVKALAKELLGPETQVLEFNLSQFKDSTELTGAFHRVRDEVLKGVTPVAFWDEFDSHEYLWLQYLLAPMQDGSFQEGQITHPLGKCIFVFAGGTAETYDTFGVTDPGAPQAVPPGRHRTPRREQEARAYERDLEKYNKYKLLKGPDFISRLHGFLNVLGPNRRTGTPCEDNSWPIRRAILLRGFLKLGDNDELDMDTGLLYALLTVPEYKFGARSFERIVSTLRGDDPVTRLMRSDLPPLALLNLDTSAKDFGEKLTQADAFPPGLQHIDVLAAAVNEMFCDKYGGVRDFASLSGDMQDSNRAAARRIAANLGLIDFKIVPMISPTDLDWQASLDEAIKYHLERMARAEHLGWNAERYANGWTYAEVTDKPHKKHSALVLWDKLPASEQAKDRDLILWIKDILIKAQHKAIRDNTP